MRRLLMSVPSGGDSGPLPNDYRYFIDLRNGLFIYVFQKDTPPPEYWPLRELPASEVESLIFGDEENGKIS